jgi:hypothetical protein
MTGSAVVAAAGIAVLLIPSRKRAAQAAEPVPAEETRSLETIAG